jgi:hypothetical protein
VREKEKEERGGRERREEERGGGGGGERERGGAAEAPKPSSQVIEAHVREYAAAKQKQREAADAGKPKHGRISQIMGAVVDVEFPRLLNAIKTKHPLPAEDNPEERERRGERERGEKGVRESERERE